MTVQAGDYKYSSAWAVSEIKSDASCRCCWLHSRISHALPTTMGGLREPFVSIERDVEVDSRGLARETCSVSFATS